MYSMRFKKFDVYYDEVIGFQILGLEQDFEFTEQEKYKIEQYLHNNKHMLSKIDSGAVVGTLSVFDYEPNDVRCMLTFRA